MALLIQGDLRLNYQLVGPDLASGVPPVALIHGLGANLAFWYLGALRHLGRERTYLLHDLRGHGASFMPQMGYRLEQMAEDFRLLLDRLGIERAHVVGHSHGARVALVFALAHPERIESLTLADTQIRALQPPMRLGEWPHWQSWKKDLAGRGVTQFPPEDSEIDFRLLAELGPRSAGGQGGRALVDPQAGRPLRLGPAARRLGEGTPRIDLHSRQMGARGAQQWQTLMEKTRASEEMQDESAIEPAMLSDLNRPALLMYGQLSHCVPTSEKLQQLLPNARRLLVPGAGHFFPIVKPRPTARALNAFFRGVDARAGRLVTPATTEPVAPRLGWARRIGPGGPVGRLARLSRRGE